MTQSKKKFIQNFEAEDLESVLKKLSSEGVTIIGDVQTFGCGKFGWMLDIEGNKIDLWESIDAEFQ